MMGNTQNVEKMMEQLELYRQRIGEISQQIQIIQLSLTDNGRAKATLEECKKIKSGSKILIPVGSDIFLRATIEDVEKVISGIGHDVAAEKPFDEAIDTIQKKIDELETLNEKMAEELQRIQFDGNLLSQRLQAMQGMGGMPPEGPQ